MPAPLFDFRILAHGLATPLRRAAALLAPRHWLLVALCGGATVAAFAFAPDEPSDHVDAMTLARALPLPLFAATEPGIYWTAEIVERGDTIGSLLARAGVEDAKAMAWLRTDPAARPVYQLRPGRALQVASDDAGNLVALRFLRPGGAGLAMHREQAGFVLDETAPAGATRVRLRSAVIQSSLFAAADHVDLPDAVTLALADVFGADIDFHHDLRRGDHFSVVFETRSVDGVDVEPGRILAAEFVNRGVSYRAFAWTAPDGRQGYYTNDGRSVRRAFLRAPLAFSRVTSGYTLARFHPILNTWRAHCGTDFAAPTGTPVRVTGNGVVTVAGRQGGYGNVIIVRHDARFSTVYAHLSRFAPTLKAGTRVTQGDTIGFVGATGWATGPHLHYEFRIDDVPRNAQTVALPGADPVPQALHAQFKAGIADALAQLMLAQALPPSALASSE